jgi:hypothetical protein
MHKLPSYSVDLVKELDKIYPPIRPSDEISDRELWGKVYQRRLVDHLISLLPKDKEQDD